MLLKKSGRIADTSPPPMIGSGQNDVSPTPKCHGGPDAGAFNGEPRNAYVAAPVATVDRARYRLHTQEQQDRDQDAVIDLDAGVARAREAEHHNTRAGVSIFLGRGPSPPNSPPHSLTESWSVMGQRSLISLTATYSLTFFAGSVLHSRYARTELFEGEATDSETRKPF